MTYPTSEQIYEWEIEWWGMPKHYPTLSSFIARKACDWQRAKDAEICLAAKQNDTLVYEDYEQGRRDCAKECAEAIREQGK